MNILLAFNQREAYCCVFAFDNFHSLITLRIAMNYLSQSNSFWKQWSCSSLPGPVISFKQVLAFMLPLSELVQVMKPSENYRGRKKKGLFSSHLMRWISSTESSDKRKLQWGRAVIGTTLSCSKVSHWAHMKLYFPGFLLNILAFIYPRIRPLWPYNTHTYITWIFFGIQSGSS